MQHWAKPRVRLSIKERRMKFANATKLHRKSGGAKPRKLHFPHPASDAHQSTTLPFVIPSEADLSRACRGGICSPSVKQ